VSASSDAFLGTENESTLLREVSFPWKRAGSRRRNLSKLVDRKYDPVSRFIHLSLFLRISIASLIHLVLRSDSCPNTFTWSQSITWFSLVAWSVIGFARVLVLGLLEQRSVVVTGTSCVVYIECIKVTSQFHMMNSSGESPSRDDPLVMCKPLRTDKFASGTLLIRPMQMKPSQYVCSDTMVCRLSALSLPSSSLLCVFIVLVRHLISAVRILFLPREATHSAVLPWQVVRPSVCLSVCDVEVSWSYRLEFCENNFTA